MFIVATLYTLIVIATIFSIVSGILQFIKLWNYYHSPDKKWNKLKQYIHKTRIKILGDREIDKVLIDIENKMSDLEEEEWDG